MKREMVSFDRLRMTFDRLRMTSVVFLFLVQGCGLFQNVSRRSTKNAASLRTNAVLTQVGSSFSDKISSEFLVRSDSVNMVYTVKFWPKGRFSFSPEKGFEGEAEKVLVIKNLQSLGQAVMHRKIQEDVHGQFKGELKGEQEVRASIKARNIDKSPPWKMIAGLFLLFLLLVYLYRKFLKNSSGW